VNKITKELLIWMTVICLFFASGCSNKPVQISSSDSINKDSAAAPSSAESKTQASTENKTTDVSNKLNTKYSTDSKDLVYNGESIPVLMYHSVGDIPGNELIISPVLLRQEMQWLKDNGYTTLTLKELYSFFENNNPVPKKSVVLTFDDGYKDNYTNMYPILKEFGFKATIFVITNTVDKNSNYLTSDQLKELDANGIDIESHTSNHDKLGTLTYERQVETLKDSKMFLEKLLNKKVDYIAYPEGSYNNSTPKAAEKAGYTMGLTTDGRWAKKKDGIFKLERVYISATFDINTFKERVTNPQYKFR
jgi:peptidoglycan/xylan/chitin deacetylase (PgdA/CDA1 family)